jgi:hypothetical protein
MDIMSAGRQIRGGDFALQRIVIDDEDRVSAHFEHHHASSFWEGRPYWTKATCPCGPIPFGKGMSVDA